MQGTQTQYLTTDAIYGYTAPSPPLEDPWAGLPDVSAEPLYQATDRPSAAAVVVEKRRTKNRQARRARAQQRRRR